MCQFASAVRSATAFCLQNSSKSVALRPRGKLSVRSKVAALVGQSPAVCTCIKLGGTVYCASKFKYVTMSVFCVVLWVWHRPATLVKADTLPSEPEILMSMIPCRSVNASPFPTHDQLNKQHHLSVFIRNILLKKKA